MPLPALLEVFQKEPNFHLGVEILLSSTTDVPNCTCCPQQKVFRNYDPGLRSQEKAVEYTRALNAAKLEKVRLFFPSP